MGVGFVLAVDEKDSDKTISILEKEGEEAFKLGVVEEGDTPICIK